MLATKFTANPIHSFLNNIVANRPTVGRLVRGLTGRQFLHRAADRSPSLDVIQLVDLWAG